MANKTANLYARIEPETKICAESILESLGIPVSTAINMFYKQIILNNGMPFELRSNNVMTEQEKLVGQKHGQGKKRKHK